MTRDLISIANEYPLINITVTADDLLEMVNYCVQTTRKEIEQRITDANMETYLSPDQVAKILTVDKSTLWRWRKQNYIKPVEVGGKRRYRMSDVKKILDRK